MPNPLPMQKPAEGAINIFQNYAVKEQSPFNLEKLSDKFRHRSSDWSIPEAYLAVIMSAAMADGQYSAIEHATLMNLVKRSRALNAIPAEALAAAEKNVNERSRSRTNWLQEACETLPADMCLPVFAHCVDIILSDGELLPQEAQFLDQLAPMLDIPADNARRVMEVLLLKAQY